MGLRKLRPCLTLTDMPSSILNVLVSIDIRQLAQAEAVVFSTRICESVNMHTVALSMENLSHSSVEFIISNQAPMWRLHVMNRFHVARIDIIVTEGLAIWYLRQRVDCHGHVIALSGRSGYCRRRRSGSISLKSSSFNLQFSTWSFSAPVQKLRFLFKKVQQKLCACPRAETSLKKGSAKNAPAQKLNTNDFKKYRR